MAKSLELCAGSPSHFTPWTFFNEGRMEEDPTFEVRERCKFFDDFSRPIPSKVRIDIGFYF